MPIKNQPYTISYFVEDLQNGGGLSGDDANHTLKLLADGALISPSGNISEPDATNMKGWYSLALNDDENIGDIMVLGGKSSTNNTFLKGQQWFNEQYLPLDTQKQIRKENERLYGINSLDLYGDAPLIEPTLDEGGYATWPSVFYDSASGVYRCYYTAKDANSTSCINHRESEDGITNWSEPVTVLTSGGIPGEWEHYGPWAPVAWKEGSEYRVMYTSRDLAATQTAIGYASGSNALDLTKEVSNPVIAPSEDWELGSCEITGLQKRGDVYHAFFVTLAGSQTSGKVFPAYARKVGYASGVIPTEWHKQSTPVFGDPDDSYETQPYHGYYSASPFRYGTLNYLVVARYGPAREDYTQFELWSCYDNNFPENTRKRVGIIQTTSSWGDYPNEDIDIISFASDGNIGIDRVFDNTEQFRMYFGAAHRNDAGNRTWSTALATEDHVRKVLYFVPSIQTDVISRLPSTRWSLSSSGIAQYIWDSLLENHILNGSFGQTIGNIEEKIVYNSGIIEEVQIDTDELQNNQGNWLTATGFATSQDVLSTSGSIINAIGNLNDFDPSNDTVANVTLVDTVTTNTDMRGTDNAALATNLMAVSGSVFDTNVLSVSGEYVSINDFVGEASALTTSAIADAVWNENIADHVSTGSTGHALAAASGITPVDVIKVSGEYVSIGDFRGNISVSGDINIDPSAVADAVWDELMSDHLNGNTFGSGIYNISELIYRANDRRRL
jgi:hypothetical protein